MKAFKENRRLTGWFQTGSSNEKAVNIRLFSQVLAILLVHAATIYNSCRVRHCCGDLLGQELANGRMNLLRLISRCDFSRANGPV